MPTTFSSTATEHSRGPESVPHRRVAVFGGGPAGMTVAHELASRGFSVEVFERHGVLGGKCRSTVQPGTGTDGRPDLPVNMGGHFFFGFYDSVADTLSRIPDGEGGTVLDRLTTGPTGVKFHIPWGKAAPRFFFAHDRAERASRQHGARRRMLRESFGIVRQFTVRDLVTLSTKTAALITSGERRQWGELEATSIFDYADADRLSRHAIEVLRFPEVAAIADADGASARVTARLLHLVVSTLGGRYARGLPAWMSLTDGPETEAWFDPWQRHLESLGGRFHLGHTVTALACDSGRITGATVRDRAGELKQVEADWYVLAVPPDKTAELMNDDLVAADPRLERIGRLRPVHGMMMQILLRHRLSEMEVATLNPIAQWSTAAEVLSSAWRLDPADYGDGTVRECVAFQIDDASATRRPGMLYGKPGIECTRQELIDEALEHLRRVVPNGEKLFAADAIHSVHIGEMHGTGERLCVDEPLFSSSPGCWENQPGAVTAVGNLFIAGAHARTRMTFDSMEAATDSGKRATNAVLAAAGVGARAAAVRDFTPPTWLALLWALDDRRYAIGRRNMFDLVAPYRPARPRTAARPVAPVAAPATSIRTEPTRVAR